MRHHIRTLLFFILFFIFLSSASFAVDTRGLSVVAKDPASGRQGEVKLYNKSYAVIIGIDQYQNLPVGRQLHNAVRDARGIEAVLRRSYQFDKIITLHNEQATKDRIMELLTEELPAQMGRDDALLLFWAGHGNQEKSDYGDLGYLIPYDGATDKIRKNITMAEIRDTISKKIPAKHVFYVMDACYSGLLTTRSVDGKSRRDLSYLKEITKESARQVLTAGGKGEEALDGGPKGHSVFTGRLIEELENASDFITANELQASIREKVHSDASARNHSQTPGFGALYGMGDFVFVPKRQNRLGDLTSDSAARQNELEQLRKIEQEAIAAKQKEQAEIGRKERELAELDAQIAAMKSRLGTTSAGIHDSLQGMLAMVEQKEKEARQLEELKKQREEEERKRQAEIVKLKQETEARRVAVVEQDIAAYEKIVASPYGKDMVIAAWQSLVRKYPEAINTATGDISILKRVLKLNKEILRDGPFIAYEDGTVLDTRTNLIWAAKDNGSDINWEKTKSYCENYRGGGYTDWRMPRLEELTGLYKKGESYKIKPLSYDVNLTELIQLSGCCPWASETTGSAAYLFNFTYGDRYRTHQSDAVGTGTRALPVRTGK